MTGSTHAIGMGYAAQRVADPRIATCISRCLGDARSVCNVGAGAGADEPADRDVIAAEPARTMIAQRAQRRGVRARAEALPFGDRAFDAVGRLVMEDAVPEAAVLAVW